ncbi:MAG: TCP-1/cpn60 chaperonin family protein, partial [Candidatus Hydrothermarchaeales archaeon]
MMNEENKHPVLILPEETQRTTGKDALRTNIMAARAVAESVKSTLGPGGMDKMLVDTAGDIVITNSGITILREMDVEHPAAKMMIEVAETQSEDVGDGTTTAVALAGELLKRAEDLLDQDVHPTVITSGYRMAAEEAHRILRRISLDVSIEDEDTLKKVALTAMSGKGAEKTMGRLAELVVRAVKFIADEEDDKIVIDVDYIKVEKREGGAIEDTEQVKGLVIDKERIHPTMPRKVETSKIVLFTPPLEIKKTEAEAKIKITDPAQLNAFR